ncbi:hypothetical protein AVEN_209071-1 [Araneus ventricosus]|uniref:Uncharacterized protein n=2 Tax=Araneus ventricosus TaxID=182803 RepID=A0A4Y2QMH8_ARAVE|nr:hypothetical protein AVEN_209071-1 [Araneus ventricosus]
MESGLEPVALRLQSQDLINRHRNPSASEMRASMYGDRCVCHECVTFPAKRDVILKFQKNPHNFAPNRNSEMVHEFSGTFILSPKCSPSSGVIGFHPIRIPVYFSFQP